MGPHGILGLTPWDPTGWWDEFYINKTGHQDQGSCSEESFEDSEDEEFRKRMEAEEKQADSDFDIDFNLSDEEDFCDKTEPENSHNVGVEDVTKEGEIIFKV